MQAVTKDFKTLICSQKEILSGALNISKNTSQREALGLLLDNSKRIFEILFVENEDFFTSLYEVKKLLFSELKNVDFAFQKKDLKPCFLDNCPNDYKIKLAKKPLGIVFSNLLNNCAHYGRKNSKVQILFEIKENNLYFSIENEIEDLKSFENEKKENFSLGLKMVDRAISGFGGEFWTLKDEKNFIANFTLPC